jgi:hypothetical protein
MARLRAQANSSTMNQAYPEQGSDKARTLAAQVVGLSKQRHAASRSGSGNGNEESPQSGR